MSAFGFFCPLTFLSRWPQIKTTAFCSTRRTTTRWHWNCTKGTYDSSMTSATTHPPLCTGRRQTDTGQNTTSPERLKTRTMIQNELYFIHELFSFRPFSYKISTRIITKKNDCIHRRRHMYAFPPLDGTKSCTLGL